jgi:hypothetical protein
MERVIMRDFAMIRSGIAIVIMAAMAMALTGCSTPKLVEDVFKKEQGTVRQDGQSYYVISAGLPVYAKASASSKVLGRLAKDEKVTRTRLEKGYAHIVTADGRLEGWVDNGRLDWRIPARETPAKAPVGEAEAPPDRSESVQPAPSTDSSGPSIQVPAVTAPQEMVMPTPEVSGDTTVPVVEAPAAPEDSTDIDVPVASPEPDVKRPVSTGDGSKPAPSIFDSF